MIQAAGITLTDFGLDAVGIAAPAAIGIVRYESFGPDVGACQPCLPRQEIGHQPPLKRGKGVGDADVHGANGGAEILPLVDPVRPVVEAPRCVGRVVRQGVLTDGYRVAYLLNGPAPPAQGPPSLARGLDLLAEAPAPANLPAWGVAIVEE